MKIVKEKIHCLVSVIYKGSSEKIPLFMVYLKNPHRAKRVQELMLDRIFNEETKIENIMLDVIPTHEVEDVKIKLKLEKIKHL